MKTDSRRFSYSFELYHSDTLWIVKIPDEAPTSPTDFTMILVVGFGIVIAFLIVFVLMRRRR